MKCIGEDKDFMRFCQNVFDSLPIGVDILDKQGKIIYINSAFSTFLGPPIEDMIGKLVTDVNPGSGFLDTLKRKQAEINIKHSFNNGKEAIVHRMPIYDDKGEVIGGMGMLVFDNVDKMQEVLNKFKMVDKELKLYKNEMARLNSAKYNLSHIIGVSKEIEDSKNKVRKFAAVNSSVLILGESGVGKELFAHSIHNESKRANMPFVSINCSAIPENLIEAELFGYEDGAFTGAKRGGNLGKFHLANGGTIFLDEIAEMPLHMQAKLLRVLQEREVVPIGAKAPQPIDVRVISATCKNLEKMLMAGKFREDLYYRLNVLTLEIPPIRERKSDIPILIKRFLDNFYKETGMFRHVSPNVMEILANYNWKGNIREIRNVVEKMSVNADDVNIGIGDLPAYIVKDGLKERTASKSGGLSQMLSAIEKEIIINVLKECNYNKTEASKKLQIPRQSLYRKIDEYGLELKL